ncbi:MAG: HDIG domain-containing protein [Anaerolineales bacterium]|nr:MAG: HDIG domain-containing protein [Anaerolineales bacterium]
MINRTTALEIMQEFVKNINLQRHMLAVEAAMQDYAVRFKGDPELWGIAGLLHDFDWEIHPTLDNHPEAGAAILRGRDVSETLIRCILSHADHTGIARQSTMEKALCACDELTGLITAVALVRPSRSLDDLRVKSIRNKWKDHRFAANIDRSEIEHAAEDLGVDLWEHVENVIHSMQRIGLELGFEPVA